MKVNNKPNISENYPNYEEEELMRREGIPAQEGTREEHTTSSLHRLWLSVLFVTR